MGVTNRSQIFSSSSLDNELDNQKSDLEENITTEINDPFGAKNRDGTKKFNFTNFSVKNLRKFGQDKSNFGKNINTHFSGPALFNIILWISLIGLMFYGYHNNIYKTLQRLPSLQKDVTIAQENKIKAQDELNKLQELNKDTSQLENKEKLISAFLPNEEASLETNQSYKIFEIAKNTGISLSSFQITKDGRTDQSVDEYGKLLSGYGIDNFYLNTRYNKYLISADADEDAILQFIAKTEESPELIFDNISIASSNNGIKFGATIKAFYKLTNQENESN